MEPIVPVPLDPSRSLKRPRDEDQSDEAHPPQPIHPTDSAVTKAEKLEGNGVTAVEPATKRVKLDQINGESKKDEQANGDSEAKVDARDRVKGLALVKPEYQIEIKEKLDPFEIPFDDDAAEGRKDDRDNGNRGGDRGGRNKKQDRKQKQKGQNKNREFGSWHDALKLCNSRANSSEFSPKDCNFGDKCNTCHDLRKYLKEGKREDLETFDGKCPVFEANGTCYAGWKCRFVASHSKEIMREDGRLELVLVEKAKEDRAPEQDNDNREGVYNVVSTKDKLDLARKRFNTDKSDQYTKWLEKDTKEMDKIYHSRNDVAKEERGDNRAQFVDPPFLASEKRRIYFGPETPVLAPLTTQGNLPFRRMCIDFGAQITYSEMALSLPLVTGQKSEWALMKAHKSEITPPRYTPTSIVQGYDNSKDLKFGAQISAGKVWQALKATEALSSLIPHLRVIDLNCGCPIDLVVKQQAGSGLLEAPARLEKMIRGMNAVSGSIPITAKIRMGFANDKPTATKLIERLAFGGPDVRERLGAPGCAAVTLHGRSRQQRYTKSADWSYIAQCAALVKSYNDKKDANQDTIKETDERTQANTKDGRMYFIGNGDCYSHVQYQENIENARVDSVMVARGALIKPWIFEEIEQGQHLDKSATERLSYIEKFCRYGLEAWGSDEVGVGTTRRFLLEWLSFAYRYVPVGILAHLPPNLQDRPQAYRGRNDLETLLASDNYRDWIKISEMYLGPAHKEFNFVPKHKSNSYEIEAEG